MLQIYPEVPHGMQEQMLDDEDDNRKNSSNKKDGSKEEVRFPIRVQAVA